MITEKERKLLEQMVRLLSDEVIHEKYSQAVKRVAQFSEKVKVVLHTI